MAVVSCYVLDRYVRVSCSKLLLARRIWHVSFRQATIWFNCIAVLL